jgi:hypothetical protein
LVLNREYAVPTPRVLLSLAAGLTLAVTACEPASITEARDQLARGGVRFAEYVVPVTIDTITVFEILDDFLDTDPITLADDVLAFAADAQLFTVGTGLAVGAQSGILDPALLNFVTEQWREVGATSLNLGEFESAAQDATINRGLVALSADNDADAPLALTDFTIGVVRLDAAGQPLRDGGGNLLYEEDAGTPILVPVADPGGPIWSVGRGAVRVDTLTAPRLVDRLVDLLLDGVRAALAGEGTVEVGDGTVGTVLATDQLRVTVTPIIGLDFTIPQSGVSFDSTTVQGGLDWSDEWINDAGDLVDTAIVTVDVENGTPFGLEVTTAVVEGDFIGDVFAVPGAVLIEPLTIGPAAVDANGLVTAAVTEADSATLLGDDIRPFLNTEFTAAVQVRLFPAAGGRGALRAQDRVVVRSSVRLLVQSGGTP